ncbi:MAG: cell surface protein SprA [Candidatus Krumholzibacteria bacterium]|nr:cell surface protein SprA [Candidatus Krumholzibacteria bacterium]
MQGSEKIAISGRSDWCSNCPKTEGQVRQDKFPDLNMEQELNVSLRGTIGEKINVEIQHSSAGEGAQSTNRVRINYKGFDDDVIQLIEMGDTDLSLSGAQLVSYSGAAKGLFGVKAVAKAGPLDLTVIASKEEGETATGSFTTSGGQVNTIPINDFDFIERQFFFFENPGDAFTQAGFDSIFPVIGGPNNDEVEVFVSLGNSELPVDFEYTGNAYVDADNSRFRDWNNTTENPDDELGTPYNGRYRQLFMENGDFALIRDYSPGDDDVRYIGIELSQSLEKSRRLAVRYRARNIYTGEEFIVGNYPYENKGTDREEKYMPANSAQTGFVGKVLCLMDSGDGSSGKRETDPIWNMMMRNVYSLGSSQIDPKSLRIRIEDTSNNSNKNIHPASNLSYLRIFGLDRVINNTGLPGKDDLVDNTLGVIDYERGYLMFPFYEPFNPPAWRTHQYLNDASDPRESGFVDSLLILDKKLYTTSEKKIQENDNHYVIVVESSSGQRVFQLSAYDIIEGSETVTVDGTRLARDADYTIDYASGTVILKTNILPDSKVDIDYQHKPLVGGGKNSLLGFSANLNLSQNSRVNGTFLYSSMGSPKYLPRLGEEPGRMMAADLNGSFVFHPKAMTAAANLLPRVDTNAQSSLNIGGEIAVSMPNPNVKGDANIDDMEGVEETNAVGLLRRGWYPASPAIKVVDGADSLRGPETQGDFRWYNAARTGKQEYFITSKRDLNPGLDERENSTVSSLFLSAISPLPGQWGGIMTGFPGGGLDLSSAQYLEIWVNDFAFDPADSTPRGGTVHVDFGRIDEDFYKPDQGVFDNEDKLPYGWTIYEDTGFDGEACTYPTDFGDGNWIANESCYRGIDCRKGNGMQDSEDLNGNGYLDETNAYYSMTFNLADSAEIDVQRDFPKDRYSTYWNDPAKTLNPRKAWRKYRIDLAKAQTVKDEPRLDAIQHMRIWIEGADSLIAFSDARVIEIAEVQFVGSRWEFNGIRNLADSLDSSGAAPGQRFTIGAINNKDDASQYRSPYQVQQEEGISNKEGSLRLNFESFAGATSFRAVKRFFGQGQNYQQYRALQFFVNPNYAVDNVSFYLQVAYDSMNYYEIEVPFDTLDSRQWFLVNVNLGDLTNLKVGTTENIVRKQIRDAIEPSRIYMATLRGNPTLFNVRFLYVGLRNRTDQTIDAGEVWFDDLRLTDVRRDIDHAENVRLTADFAGILQLSTNWTRTGPEFRSLRQSRGSGTTNSGLNLSAKTEINHFIPTAGFNLPVNFQYNSTNMLPKYMINSDVEIADPAVRDSLKNVSASYGFNVSMSRRGSSNAIMRNLFDNLRTGFSYSKRYNYSPTRRDTTWTMNGNLNYQIQFRDKRELGLFKGIKWRYWLSSASYETGASRQTKEEYTRSGTSELVRRPFFYDARWSNAVNTLYEPFDAVKITFNMSDQRDLGVDHTFRGVPIGVETSFGHNLSFNYQPSPQTPILSEFNPRFDFKSRYAEDLAPGKRQGEDPFGTRYINNQREMTFAFMVDAGRYITLLGEKTHFIQAGGQPKRRAQSFGGSASGGMNAAKAMEEMRLRNEANAKKNENAGKIEALEGDETPAVPQGGVTPGRPSPAQPPPGSPSGGLNNLGMRRVAGDTISAAMADTSGAAKVDTAAARADTTAVRKRDPLMPVRKLVRLLGSIEPLNANVNLDHRSSYERIYERADLWYQLGFTDKAGVPSSGDSVEDNSPLRATNNVSVDLRSSIGLTANIGLEAKARFDMGQDESSGRRTKNSRSTWPALTLDWKGMEKYRYLSRFITQSNFVVSFERRRSESQSGLENAYTVSPNWNLEWKNKLSSNLGFNFNKKTRVKNDLELWDKSWTVIVALKYNIEGSRGFGIPLPLLNKKKFSFKSVLTTGLNLQYNMLTTQIDPASAVLSISPNVSYRFSNSVQGGAGVDYKRTSGGRLGQVRQMIDVRLSAEFRF